MSIYGPVLEAVVPKVQVKEGLQGQRGFGFVTFACAEDAERAVKNDRRLTIKGREVAVDSCLGRREYQKQKAASDEADAKANEEKVSQKTETQKEGDEEDLEEDNYREDANVSQSESADEEELEERKEEKDTSSEDDDEGEESESEDEEGKEVKGKEDDELLQHMEDADFRC